MVISAIFDLAVIFMLHASKVETHIGRSRRFFEMLSSNPVQTLERSKVKAGIGVLMLQLIHQMFRHRGIAAFDSSILIFQRLTTPLSRRVSAAEGVGSLKALMRL